MDVVPDDVRVERRDESSDEPDADGPQPRADLENDERRCDRDHDLRDPDGEPLAAEREVKGREEPAVERLRVGGRDVGDEAEGPVVDQRRREAVALVDELLEDGLALAHEHEETRKRCCHDHDDGCRRSLHLGSASMGATSRERYAVVSCHVERPLDARVWSRFSALQEARPGGFAIAALMRPPDRGFGEDESLWLARAREAAARGPLGHHTHWTAPDHARPRPLTEGHKPGSEVVTQCHERPGERVRAEGRRLRELGLAPTLFCGGGWYTDVEVAEACAELGYVDCTPRAARPPYLAAGEKWASLDLPTDIGLPSGSTLRSVPTTHSLGDLARALIRRNLPDVVHVYLHDTDLLDRRRRAILRIVLPVLARRARTTDLDALVAWSLADLPRVGWDDVARL